MLIELADWKMDVDIPLTMLLSDKQAREHCTCGYCRNFYAAIDSVYPMLRPFLLKFGIQVEGPDELCPFEPTIYEVSYIVQGRVMHEGKQPLYIDGVPLKIQTSQQSDICTEHPEPFFVLSVGLMELPWLLEEPMSEVISPANEEEFLSRMQKKLLARIPNDSLLS